LPQSIAGLKQAGLAEAVAQVIKSLPQDHQGMYWAHVGLFGGVAGTEGIGERL
jgi:actin-related protein 6